MALATAVTISVPSALRRYCGGVTEIPVSAETVRAALSELERAQPALFPNICDETGAVRRHLNVFVNATHIRDLEGLDSRLSSGDTVTILTSVSGG